MKVLLAGLAVLTLAAPAGAAIVPAGIKDNFFDPQSVIANQGDTVSWTNQGLNTHTVTFAGFGSPALAHDATFDHQFESAGTFNFHCSIHTFMTGKVTVYGPTAVAKAIPKQALTNVMVAFDGSASKQNDPAGSIASYEWDFADGSLSATGAMVSHAFANPGTYNVVLTVTDDKGATDTATVPVRIALTAIRISNAKVVEGDSGWKRMKFVVRLTRISSMTTTVHYATVNGTARAPADYRAKSGNLTFLPGQTAKAVYVRVYGDFRNEPNETFKVRLSAPVNAIFADRVGLGTTVDND